MFRPLLVHPQALQENRSKSCLCFTALCDPKCLQFLLQEYKVHKLAYICICIYIYIYIYILNLFFDGFSMKIRNLSDVAVYYNHCV